MQRVEPGHEDGSPPASVGVWTPDSSDNTRGGILDVSGRKRVFVLDLYMARFHISRNFRGVFVADGEDLGLARAFPLMGFNSIRPPQTQHQYEKG